MRKNRKNEPYQQVLNRNRVVVSFAAISIQACLPQYATNDELRAEKTLNNNPVNMTSAVIAI